jgi:hypothetical protein
MQLTARSCCSVVFGEGTNVQPPNAVGLAGAIAAGERLEFFDPCFFANEGAPKLPAASSALTKQRTIASGRRRRTVLKRKAKILRVMILERKGERGREITWDMFNGKDVFRRKQEL